eukprot:7275871-Alexandrium_andersonii.AAC.1
MVLVLPAAARRLPRWRWPVRRRGSARGGRRGLHGCHGRSSALVARSRGGVSGQRLRSRGHGRSRALGIQPVECVGSGGRLGGA